MSEIKTRTRVADPIYHKQYYENKLKNKILFVMFVNVKDILLINQGI